MTHVAEDTFLIDPYPGKPKLTFRPDGTFKITVFSDQHFGENPWDSWGPEQDANSTRLMKRVLPDEKPDYVVLNGDLITGENTFKENATSLIDEIVAPLNELKIPFSSTQGNHDNQVNITHLAEILREQAVAPLSYTRRAPPGVGGDPEQGPGNYWVPVYTTPTSSTPSLILWFFDSRGGFSSGTNSTPVEDWVHDSVAKWIESEVETMDQIWGPSEENRAALAFVHIPPHVVQNLQLDLNSTKDPGLNADELGQGSTQATTDPSSAGKDLAFWNALTGNVKNLKALISGHDHGNEWCKREPSTGVIFCFDKHGGYGGYGEPEWGYGVRNILFTSPKADADVETWIRLEEGQERARVVLGPDFS
ncbi:Metallo-dependent phosphatase [Dendrothele bispora CBS 962.96]|uniref:Metallo-dependent phosphatase n=1 Tax=Dendrothele bispora (strain CBS 962.96) TaxID=1314807 RepID=A0A4S8M5H2_DENBC|nr:Metallo-dependent phosphatase [Dendrothele bispora CBS 962.96]